MRIKRILSRVLPAALLAAGAFVALPGTPAQAKSDFTAKPFMGFSTWSVESSTHSGYGTNWLNEGNVKNAADTVSAKLKSAGYNYIDLDAGWNATLGWNEETDGNAIPVADATRFPDGIASTISYIHNDGLSAGLYAIVGLPTNRYDNNSPILNTSCHTQDIAKKPLTLVPNGWNNAYEIDFSNPCAQSYINSIANRFASWGVDLIKVDGTTQDNVGDFAAWSKAIDQSGRKMYLTSSAWPVPVAAADGLHPYVNGVRVDTDIECYCDTVSAWDHSVSARFADLPNWISHLGPNYWPDLDSMPINNNTGSGIQDGINDTERQTVMNFWSMASAPLYVGGDVWFIDSKAVSILTNPEVVAVDQAGVIPTQVAGGNQQIWKKKLADGSTVVGVYNLGSGSANVTVNFSSLGLSGTASIRDLAARTDLGTATNSWTASGIPAHGSRLIKLTGAPSAGPLTGVPSGKCVDVNGSYSADGAGITLYTCNSQPNQAWTRTGGTYRSLGKCLDITGSGTANGTRVDLWSCNGSAAQQWTAPGDGTLRNPASGRCLDAAGAGTADGTPVVIWDCGAQPNQQWRYPS